MPVRAIPRIEHRQIELLDRLQHKPRQMVPRQPIQQRRRHQEGLLTITIQEVLRHTGIP